MKTLVVTGRLAQDQVRLFAKGADVLVLDVDVAAFITPEMLLRAAPVGYDLILVPGAITADFREAECILGAKIRLGPKHAVDLAFVLLHLDEIDLSPNIPACQLLLGSMRRNALDDVVRLENDAKWALQIKDIKIGGTSRMKVLAEIVDSTRFSSDTLAKKIHYYEEQGADMIDLGVPLDATPYEVLAALDVAKKATHLPVSIDTVMPQLIEAGLKAGADLILSLNDQNLDFVGEAVAEANVPAVVIPGPGRIDLLENVGRALGLGISVIADPVLEPPLQGLATSLHEYILFNKAYPKIPLFFGVGNVTELLDADTIGTNALLAALGAEVHASVLFTPEYSAKARNSVQELQRASQMMLLAKERRTPPKDLGIDLLILKEKRQTFEETMPKEIIKAGTEHKYEPDPSGSFRICLKNGLILAQNGRTTVAGSNAREILNTIIDMELVTRLDHVGYLGRELEKAQIALSLKRSYIQDELLWPLEKG